VLADINAAAGEQLASEIGQNSAHVRADLTDESSGQGAVEEAARSFGGLRGVVNWASIAIAQRTLGRDGVGRQDVRRVQAAQS
jgi:NAD(P)-dependent dehydrogenase (short-subunit alcohol dehydrogenase family)